MNREQILNSVNTVIRWNIYSRKATVEIYLNYEVRVMQLTCGVISKREEMTIFMLR